MNLAGLPEMLMLGMLICGWAASKGYAPGAIDIMSLSIASILSILFIVDNFTFKHVCAKWIGISDT